MSDLKRILVFLGRYLPGKNDGGPIKSIYNLTELIGEDFDFNIVCSDHDRGEPVYEGINPGWNQVGKAKVLYINNSERNAQNIRKIIEEVNPSLIYLSGLFGATVDLPAMYWAKIKGIKVLVAPRGELLTDALKKNTQEKLGYIDCLRASGILDYIYFQATSQEELKCIMNVTKLSNERVFLLENVPTTIAQKEELNKEKEKLRVCFVGRIVPRKCLHLCLSYLKRICSKIAFDIFGPVENKEYWDECQNIIKTLPKNVSVHYKGVIDQIEILDKYKEYDCFISPTGFENYGQSIVEAMLHDVPVIISKGTTPWDSVAEYNAGYVIPLENEDLFVQAIEQIAAMNNEEYKQLVFRLREYVNNTFNFEELKKQYLSLFNMLIAGKNNSFS